MRKIPFTNGFLFKNPQLYFVYLFHNKLFFPLQFIAKVSKYNKLNILARKKEIKDFIFNGRTEPALKLLIDFAVEFCPNKKNTVILLSSDYSELRRKEIIDQSITSEKANIQRGSIKRAILELADEMANEALPIPKAKLPSGQVRLSEEQMIEVIEEYGTERTKELIPKIKANRQKIIVKAKNLTKAYKSSNFQLELDDLELRLGEITAVVGENATGKTCLLRIIAGDLAHDTGDLQYPLFQTDGKKRLNWVQIKPQIAYVPQALSAWRGSLLNNLRYEAAIHGVKGKDNYEATDYILERLGLSNHIHKTWRELSGGYKLRFSLAKALLWKAKLLVIDEPLAHLDIKARWVVLKDLQNLAQSLQHPIAILISSQDLHETEAIADNVLFVRGGRVENMGKIADWGKNQPYHVFEFACDVGQAKLEKILEESHFPKHKLWYNAPYYLLSVDKTIGGEAVLQFFAQQGIELQYYRNISHSIKTKFYEKELF